MGKLHQHLAVESDVKGAEEKIRKECFKTFSSKSAHYDGHYNIFKPLEATVDGDGSEIEEEKHIVDTVPHKLAYIQTSIVRLIDFILQKEIANTNAKADLVIEEDDGTETIIAENIPATMLLTLEKKLIQIRDLYNTIPTCDPLKRWIKDPTEDHRYITEKPETRIRSKKTAKPIVLYDATDKHPAQTQMINEDIPYGKLEITHKSGRMTSADKSGLMERIDTLIRGIKKSRQKANDQELTNDKIGKKLFNYIHG